MHAVNLFEWYNFKCIDELVDFVCTFFSHFQFDRCVPLRFMANRYFEEPINLTQTQNEQWNLGKLKAEGDGKTINVILFEVNFYKDTSNDETKAPAQWGYMHIM